MENFETLIYQYANEKGFALDSNGAFYARCRSIFSIYSNDFQKVMGLKFFTENIASKA